jgi:hypothetical protein
LFDLGKFKDTLKFDNKNVSQITTLSNNFGFSFQIPLPDDIEQLINPDKKYVFFSLLFIMVDDKALQKDESNIVPLQIRFSFCQQEVSGLFESSSYIFDNNINLKNYIINDKYYYNIVSNELLKKENDKYLDLESNVLFNELYEMHLNRNDRSTHKAIIIKKILKIAAHYLSFCITSFFSLLYTAVTGKKIIFSVSMFGRTNIKDQISKN